MDPGFLLIENFARFAAVVGLILAAPLFVWGGLFVDDGYGRPQPVRGRPQRRHQRGHRHDRHWLLAFILPRVVGPSSSSSPSGGLVFEREPGVNCDGMFRQQLIINRTASTPSRMVVISWPSAVGSQFDDCNEAIDLGPKGPG